jgi:hypothetical protein
MGEPMYAVMVSSKPNSAFRRGRRWPPHNERRICEVTVEIDLTFLLSAAPYFYRFFLETSALFRGSFGRVSLYSISREKRGYIADHVAGVEKLAKYSFHRLVPVSDLDSITREAFSVVFKTGASPILAVPQHLHRVLVAESWAR